MFEQRHSTIRPGGPLRKVVAAAALLACAGLAACTGTPQPSAVHTVAEADAAPLPGNAELDPGTYTAAIFAVPFRITVPEGWEMKGNWLLIKGPNDPDAVFLNFLEPAAVPADACNWMGTIEEVAPTVDAFAEALAAQRSTSTSEPIDVMVGGYSGVEFDLAVEGIADAADCDAGHVCIHSEWLGECSRYYQSVTRSETYRVLNLDGDRAAISVGGDEGAPGEWKKEAREIFDSITFVTDE